MDMVQIAGSFATDPRPECQATRDVAAHHGLLMVNPDYRATTSWMGPAAEADMLQLIDIIRSDYPIDTVILLGGSMGATSRAYLRGTASGPH